MEIRKEKNGNALILHLSGKLAIKESQALDQVVRSELSGITDLNCPEYDGRSRRYPDDYPCERNGGQRPGIDRVQRFHED